MTATVVLFDIDGTLVTCGGAGRLAMERAFRDLVGDRSVTDFGFGGMTDRAIAREGLGRAGLDADEATLDAFLERYLGYLAEELPRSHGYRVLEGVTRLLDDLEAERDARRLALGLGTGNLVRGAQLKLERGGLWQRFGFGGYGSDHEDRAELLAVGARRGAAQLGLAPREVRVVIVGDTPRDIAAAHAIGARCVAVATGAHDAAALGAHRPSCVYASLSEVRVEDLLAP